MLEIWSRQESVRDGQMDRQMKGISIVPLLLHGGKGRGGQNEHIILNKHEASMS